VSSFLGLAKIQYSVPSGNFGDMLAGFYARQMGLPIHNFIIATNENDVLDRFLKTGRYDRQVKTDGVDPVKQTLSPAMDILISSNFERLLWHLSMDSNKVINKPSSKEISKACFTLKDYFDQLQGKNGFIVPDSVLNHARSLFSSYRVDDAQTSDAIKRYYHHQFVQDYSGYILDPHTAVGVVN
jgi:threonine synthase